MPTDVIARIKAFRTAPPEADERYAIVEELAEHLDEPPVLRFFVAVAGDEGELDLARIEILKAWQFWGAAAPRARATVGRCIASLVRGEPDVTVRQWAAIAAGGYVDECEVFDALADTLRDDTVDLDVRHNCLVSLKNAADGSATRRALTAVRTHARLGTAARRALAALGKKS